MDWREVASLAEAEQRGLLTSGDPAERVWSCWALALRLGRSALGDLEDDFDLEALPGVRCQLVVVMAGLGARDLVRTAALDDPDATVRATACQYIVRTEPAGPDAAVEFALDRMRRDVPRVRHALFEEAHSGRLPLPDGAVLEFLTNVDLETRQLALQSLAAIPGATAEILEAMAARVLEEPDSLLRRDCITLYLRIGSAPDLVRAISTAPPDRVSEVVEAIRKAGVALRWVELYPLATRPEPDILVAILSCLSEPIGPDAIHWISGRVAASLEVADIAGPNRSLLWTFRRTALAILHGAVTPETVHLVDRSTAEALLDEMDLDEGYAEYEDDDPEAAAGRAKRELLAKHVASFRAV